MSPQAKILNVNDSAANLYTTTRILRRAGFEVLEASDGLGLVYFDRWMARRARVAARMK